MLETSNELERLLLSEYSVVENEVGLGKLILNEAYNEVLITNGKSLITYKNVKLEESTSISDEERLRIISLSSKLIKQRMSKDIMSEIYLGKDNLEYLIYYLHKLNGEEVELKYIHKSNRLMISNTSAPLINMLKLSHSNAYNADSKVKLDSEELRRVLLLMYREMKENAQLNIIIQANEKPTILEMDSVSACISCNK